MNRKKEEMKINLSRVVRFMLWGLVGSYGSDSVLGWCVGADGFISGTKKEPWLGSCVIEFCLDLMQQKYLQILLGDYKILQVQSFQ